MDYFRMRSSSGDLTVQAFQCSPFRECGHGNPLLGPDPFASQSMMSSFADSEPAFNLASYMNQRSPRRVEIDLPTTEDFSQSVMESDSGDYYDSSHVIEAISHLAEISDEVFDKLATNRPWEQVPIQDINALHPFYSDLFAASDVTRLDIGAYHSLLSFYIRQAVETNEHYRDRMLNIRTTCTRDLIRFATTLGLVPLVVKLHLEYTNKLEIPMERISYLLYQRANSLRKSTRRNSSFSPIASSSVGSDYSYYPGIELKLGKERDTVIRPMLTSIFRASRDAFKTALLEEGLRYGELRMWKDSQLCTAIHVANSFRPGVWDRAVELHMKKTAKKKRSTHFTSAHH